MTHEESMRFRLAQTQERAQNAHPSMRIAFSESAADFKWALDEIVSLRQQLAEARHQLTMYGCADHGKHDEDECALCRAEHELAEAREKLAWSSEIIKAQQERLDGKAADQVELRQLLDEGAGTGRVCGSGTGRGPRVAERGGMDL